MKIILAVMFIFPMFAFGGICAETFETTKMYVKKTWTELFPKTVERDNLLPEQQKYVHSLNALGESLQKKNELDAQEMNELKHRIQSYRQWVQTKEAYVNTVNYVEKTKRKLEEAEQPADLIERTSREKQNLQTRLQQQITALLKNGLKDPKQTLDVMFVNSFPISSYMGSLDTFYNLKLKREQLTFLKANVKLAMDALYEQANLPSIDNNTRKVLYTEWSRLNDLHRDVRQELEETSNQLVQISNVISNLFRELNRFYKEERNPILKDLTQLHDYLELLSRLEAETEGVVPNLFALREDVSKVSQTMRREKEQIDKLEKQWTSKSPPQDRTGLSFRELENKIENSVHSAFVLSSSERHNLRDLAKNWQSASGLLSDADFTSPYILYNTLFNTKGRDQIALENEMAAIEKYEEDFQRIMVMEKNLEKMESDFNQHAAHFYNKGNKPSLAELMTRLSVEEGKLDQLGKQIDKTEGEIAGLEDALQQEFRTMYEKENSIKKIVTFFRNKPFRDRGAEAEEGYSNADYELINNFLDQLTNVRRSSKVYQRIFAIISVHRAKKDFQLDDYKNELAGIRQTKQKAEQLLGADLLGTEVTDVLFALSFQLEVVEQKVEEWEKKMQELFTLQSYYSRRQRAFRAQVASFNRVRVEYNFRNWARELYNLWQEKRALNKAKKEIEKAQKELIPLDFTESAHLTLPQSPID